jgi:hypothetical protein
MDNFPVLELYERVVIEKEKGVRVHEVYLRSSWLNSG